MTKAIRNHWKDFSALVLIAVISLGVAGYVLGHQRFYLPHWVPLIGSDFVDYKVELNTAQSITPGQGQTVNVAGVPVGEIRSVDLKNGRAIVGIKIRRKYTPIYKDATVLVRPKTGLEDVILELSPGSKRSGVLPHNGVIPASQTLPETHLDEILAGLDADTRDYLQLLLGGAGQGLAGEGRQLSASLKRFEPTSRDVERFAGALKARRANIRRVIHNFSALSQALGSKDQQLARLVASSNAVFRTFASEDANVRRTLQELPTALSSTRTGLGKADRLAKVLGPSLGALRPGARALGPSLRQTRPFLAKTTPVIRDQLRPFARDALPTIKQLRPAARDLASATPALTESLKVANYLLNELAYDKPGDSNQSYLYWMAWVNHIGNTIFATGDANGNTRRGLLVISCAGLETLDQLSQVNQQLGLLIKLLNPPRQSAVCPQTSQPGTGLVGRSSGGVSTLSPDAPKPIAAAAGGGN